MAITYYLNESNHYLLEFDLVDEMGAKISKSILGTLQLTLYHYNPDIKGADRYNMATINGRYQQNVLDASNVSVTETSSKTTVSWQIQAADTAKFYSNQEQELKRALFVWYWSSKQNSQEFNLWIREVGYI